MRKIKIKNIGPIIDIDFNLKKINILMGPQSSGKSTIAKIVSYCQWVEKRYLLDGEYKYDVNEQLLEFHHLNRDSFNENSSFSYESDFIKIAYRGKKLSENIKKKETDKVYEKSKNIYIPSERNFVSAIPNLSKYKETNDNIMSFVYDWFTAKRNYDKNNTLPILNLGVNFYNKFENDIDILQLDKGKEILLREGSSGLQSIIPLLTLIEYLTKDIYEIKSYSVEDKDLREKLTDQFLINHKLEENDTIKRLDEKELSIIISEFRNFLNLQLLYQRTNFIIEEPEQNLYPLTQRDLIYFLFQRMDDPKDHSLLLTTHSPYILYAINNCLMGYNVKNNISGDEINELNSHNSWIDPKVVSIWQVKSGKIFSVLDERTNTVTRHYFNEITKEIMDEYYEMLNYFSYDEKN